MITIKYSLKALSPVLTGTSGVIGKDADLVMKKDSLGNAYIPAKHIKGILKDLCDEFIQALGNEYKGLSLKEIFGDEGNSESKIRFSNLITTDSKIDYRTSVKLDKNGVSAANNLFKFEYCDTGTVFHGEISLKNMDDESSKFILASLLHIDFIGTKSKGFGYVEPSIEIDKKPVTFKNLENLISEISEKLKNNIKSDKEKLDEISKLKEYVYKLTFQEDYIIKQLERGNQIESRSLVQGTAVRGALIKELSKHFKEEYLQRILSVMKISSPEPQGFVFSPATLMKSKYKHGDNYLFKDLVFDNKSDEEVKYQRVASHYVRENDFEVLKLNKRDEISIAINSSTKTAEDGKIYNSEYIEKPEVTFEGKLTIPEEIESYLENIKIYIGRGKTKGFGKVEFRLEARENQNRETTLKNRLEDFKKNGVKKIYTIDFEEDMIVPFSSINDFGNNLSKLYKLGKFIPEKSVIVSEILGGYSLLNNIRKHDELVILKGSVLSYELENVDTKNLETLEKTGLGLRTNEGFGKIRVCAESHFLYGGAKNE